MVVAGVPGGPRSLSAEVALRWRDVWAALRGRAVHGRLRWALLGVVAGGVVGAGTAVLARRASRQDAPDAQDPEHLQAVIDLLDDGEESPDVDDPDRPE